MSLPIDMISDVVCPWCFIGKRRLEKALALRPNIPVEVHFRPYFLNPWVPREGMSREDYLTTKFGSPERYRAIGGRVSAAAAAEGLIYAPDKITRQPNTLDCHRLILWAGETGNAGRMKQRLMDVYFTEGGDLSDRDVLVEAAAASGLDAAEARRRLASDRDIERVAKEAEVCQGGGHRWRALLCPGRSDCSARGADAGPSRPGDRPRSPGIRQPSSRGIVMR